MAIVKQQKGYSFRRWNKAEYYRLNEQGFFLGQRVELLEGRIVVLSPQHAPHFSTVDRVAEVMRRYFSQGYLVRMQGPIDLGQITEPEPDVCVVTGKRGDYDQAHPTTAVLIIEVSDSTVVYDRRRKGSLLSLEQPPHPSLRHALSSQKVSSRTTSYTPK